MSGKDVRFDRKPVRKVCISCGNQFLSFSENVVSIRGMLKMQNQEVLRQVNSIIDDAIVHASSIRLSFEYLIEHIKDERIAGFYYILADSSEQLENMLKEAINLSQNLEFGRVSDS